MMTPDELTRFLDRHRIRYAPHDWPDPESEDYGLFIEVWIHAFLKADVNYEDAEQASVELGAKPPRFRSDHLPAILEGVREIEHQRSVGRQSMANQAWREAMRGAASLPPEPKPPGITDWRKDWRKFAASLADRSRLPWDLKQTNGDPTEQSP